MWDNNEKVIFKIKLKKKFTGKEIIAIMKILPILATT